MRIVFVTQRVDPADPILGATVAKIRALAARCDEVVVLADGAVPGALPRNGRIRPFHSSTKLGRGARFTRALARELTRSPRPDAVVAHMCPIYAVLAAPLARPLGVPVVLWFTHWNRTRTLEAAVRLSDAVVSVDPLSVPVRSSKVVGIGHGIDVADFACAGGPRPGSAAGRLEALALGRYSAAKGLDTIVRAVGVARGRGVDVTLRCHGTASTDGERRDRERLERLVAELRLGEAVSLGDPVPRSQVPELHRSADVLVNNMRAGAADKVVFEAAASCLPILASNPSFDALVAGLEPSLRFPRDDAEALAARLADLAALEPGVRRALGARLRERVVRGHSVESWADGILAVCAAKGTR